MADPVAEELGGKRKRPSNVTASGEEEEESQKRQKTLSTTSTTAVATSTTTAAPAPLKEDDWEDDWEEFTRDKKKDAATAKKIRVALKRTINSDAKFSASAKFLSWPLFNVLPREGEEEPKEESPFFKPPLVLESEKEALIAASDPMPDSSVRVIDPSRIRFWDERWSTCKNISKKGVAKVLDIDHKGLEFVMDKMLVFPEGSSSATLEPISTPGVIAKLFISLPSASGGGDLVVKHPQHGDPAKTRSFTFRSFESVMVMWFSDCPHEIKEHTSPHCRIALTYDVVSHAYSHTSLASAPPSFHALGKVFSQIDRLYTNDIVLPVEESVHRSANLPSGTSLRGNDLAVMKALVAYAKIQQRGLIDGPPIALYTARVEATIDEVYVQDGDREKRTWRQLLDGEHDTLEVSDFIPHPELSCQPHGEFSEELTLFSARTWNGVAGTVSFRGDYCEGFIPARTHAAIVISILPATESN